jgi:hypothetical protein
MNGITVYIEKEQGDALHERLTNDTGAALVQYEFTVLGQTPGGNIIGICDEGNGIDSGYRGSFATQEGVHVQAADFETGEGTFATPNAPVYWNPATGLFSDTETDGYYYVGDVVRVLDSNGVIVFSVLRKAQLIET